MRRMLIGIAAASATIGAGACTEPSTYVEARGTAACTQGCSGHEAGWRWARTHHLMPWSRCGGSSRSFKEGCEAYAHRWFRWTRFQPTPADLPPTVAEQLELCSPFVDATDKRTMEFLGGKVTLEASDGGNDVVGQVDVRDGQVTVTIAGEAKTFALFVWSSGTQCTLASGSVEAANLSESWFSDTDIDPPEGERDFGP